MKIVSKFAAVSEQGLGRVGLRRFGVPSEGALDTESLQLANVLVGLPPGTPALEVVGGSVELEVESSGSVAIVGAETWVSANGVEQPGQGRFRVERGDRIGIKLGLAGFAYYVAIGPPRTPARLAEPPTSLFNHELRILAGPQGHLFEGEPLRVGLTVSNEISRQGVRLASTGATHAMELRSEPACPGAIQLTPNGTPIILGPDGPTIGGYPKIAVVCTADLSKVGQFRPGQAVSFRSISMEEAHEAIAQASRHLRIRLAQLTFV